MLKLVRWMLPLLAFAAVVPATASAAYLPPIHHVFVIVLENESASTTFGPSAPAPYLAHTLTSEGAYVPKYYGIGHHSNDNYIAMISGQAPNTSNQNDCFLFSDFATTAVGADGQQQGLGCVYPSDIQTISGQLTSAGLTWRDYNESMGNTPSREAATCGHPAIGALDNTEAETAQDAYAARHNPFVYFHSIIDDKTLCDTHVVNLNSLSADLSSAATTPNYVFITPDLCSDGHDATCSAPGRVGGFAGIEQFLQHWVPVITGSPAFKQQNGLLIVTFDESDGTDSSSCCGEIAGPGAASPGLNGPGGGDIGAVMLSPCIKPGTVTQTPYNHYTMLRSVEDIFALPHLGYAQLPGETSFGSDIFTKPCEPPPVVKARAHKTGNTKISVTWSATDKLGPGIASYQLQVRSSHSGAWGTVLRATTHRSYTYRGKKGKTYRFRVRATDTLGIASPYAQSKPVKLK